MAVGRRHPSNELSQLTKDTYSLRQTTVLSKHFNDYEVKTSILGLRCGTPASPENKEISSTPCLEKYFNDKESSSISCLTCVEELQAGEQKAERKEKYFYYKESLSACPVLVHTEPVSLTDNALRIHGYTVSKYQSIYHSVVDPMLTNQAGGQKIYSLKLGRKVKQKLWERLHFPKVLENPKADGQYCLTESFSGAGLKRRAPQFKVDISGEPWPQHPRKKKSRH